MVFSLRGELCPHRAFTGSMNRISTMKRKESEPKRILAKVQSRHERQNDNRASKWLAKHAPKAKPELNPKPQPLEKWQIRSRQQRQQRRSLSKPLLRGVE